MSVRIEPFAEAHWPATWGILEPIFRAGETYAVPTDITEGDARRLWVESPLATFVAVDDEVLGSYFLKPNHAGPGAHVANGGYVVSPDARGRGIASSMCDHSQADAVRRGFKAMQYNLVVSTNTGAIRLWERHGFTIVGTLPGAFAHPTEGLVDAFVMFKTLDP